jgi:phenylalanyl-tRNA synthetase beta chain
MKISYNWLQKYFIEKLPDPETLAQGIIFHSFEVEEVDKVGDDTVFEIKILPDRAHDCLCHFGIAKEVSAIFGIKIKEEIINNSENTPKSELEIKVNSHNCRRYMGRMIKGVKVGPSPSWLSSIMVTIGQKSINNIVDATNYVMYDIGNPIHAFDLDKLASPRIIVENAKNNEKFILLDGKEVTLDESILTIRDEKDALAVAGVKGGKKAEIDMGTKNIIIEVANFEPVSTRKSAKKLAIFTDSAKRFENDIPPALAPVVMERITNLIKEVAGGEVSEFIDIYDNNEEVHEINFTENYLENMLGLKIPTDSINDILDRFGYKYTNDEGLYKVTIPYLRLDISGPHDMVEEIGRIYGYDKIIPILPKIDFNIKENKIWKNINITKDYLANLGYREVMNYAFSNKGEVEVMASASDKNFLRTNLTDGIKKSYELNKFNLPLLDCKEIKIFEIGTIFLKDAEEIRVAYGDKKEIIEMSLDNFVEEKLSLDIHSLLNTQEEDSQGSTNMNPFKMWSIYPFISRDIAVWVPNDIDKNKLKNILIEEGTDILIKEPYLFDLFSKDGKTSYAYRLVFQSYNKTLTDEEINPIMDKINSKISSLDWQVR